MADEQERVGRCGWIALALVIFLVSGLTSGGLVGGVAALRAASALLGGYAGSDLVVRAVVFAGMVLGLLLAAAIIMFLTALTGRVGSLQFLRTLPGLSGLLRKKQEPATRSQ